MEHEPIEVQLGRLQGPVKTTPASPPKPAKASRKKKSKAYGDWDLDSAAAQRHANRERMSELWKLAKEEQRNLTASENEEILRLHQMNSEMPEFGVVG